MQFYSRLGVEAFGADIHEKALETLMIMKEQLAEKEKEIEYQESMKILAIENKNQKAIEQLEQIRKEFEIKLKCCKWEDKMLVGKFCNITNEIIDNTINELKKVK